MTSAHAAPEFHLTTVVLPLVMAVTLLAIVITLKKKDTLNDIHPR
ncbi:MAG: hypothetical protein ACUVT5_02705 [Candidatus Bathyarchaeales archaeon]